MTKGAPVVNNPTETLTIGAPIVNNSTETMTIGAPIVIFPTVTTSIGVPIVTFSTVTMTKGAPVVNNPTELMTIGAPIVINSTVTMSIGVPFVIDLVLEIIKQRGFSAISLVSRLTLPAITDFFAWRLFPLRFAISHRFFVSCFLLQKRENLVEYYLIEEYTLNVKNKRKIWLQ
ncbi:MAG: hypothetical protein GTO20_10210 [Candidatus Aminicenantes bacterium]|nr:hypothetical protein [Candidatus Aminicenantes bacterium]